jgi:Protein of unknown function (DUF4238)
VETRVSVASACQVDDLNAFFGAPAAHRHAPERDYFTPQIDTPAAGALKAIVDGGVKTLSPAQRYSWARFLVSLGVRTPETLRVMGPAEWRKGIAQAQARGHEGAPIEAILQKWFEDNKRALERNKPLEIAMDLSSDPTKIAPIKEMQWWARRFRGNSLLLSDRPLLAWPRMPYPCGMPLDDRNCLIVLPISPNIAFLATANAKYRRKINQMPEGRLARSINEQSIWRAAEYVFAADDSSEAFIIPRVAGKAQSGWKPGLPPPN